MLPSQKYAAIYCNNTFNIWWKWWSHSDKNIQTIQVLSGRKQNTKAGAAAVSVWSVSLPVSLHCMCRRKWTDSYSSGSVNHSAPADAEPTVPCGVMPKHLIVWRILPEGLFVSAKLYSNYRNVTVLEIYNVKYTIEYILYTQNNDAQLTNSPSRLDGTSHEEMFVSKIPISSTDTSASHPTPHHPRCWLLRLSLITVGMVFFVLGTENKTKLFVFAYKDWALFILIRFYCNNNTVDCISNLVEKGFVIDTFTMHLFSRVQLVHSL